MRPPLPPAPKELVAQLKLHAKSSICNIEPADCAQWAITVEKLLGLVDTLSDEVERLSKLQGRAND